MKPCMTISSIIITLLLVHTCIVSCESESDSIFRGILLTRFGFYNQHSKCKPGQYALGMRLKTKLHGESEDEDYANKTEVTAIEFTCSDRISTGTTKFVHKIGKHGEWGEYFECPTGFGVGISLTMNKLYKLQFRADSFVENIELKCSPDPGSSQTFWQRVLNRFRKYNLLNDQASSPIFQSCDPYSAITEFKTIANSVTEFDSGERIAVESVEAGCQNIESPAVLCDFSFHWKRVDNANCTMTSQSMNSTEDLVQQTSCNFDASFGFYYNKEINDFDNILTSYNLDENIIMPSVRMLLFQKLLIRHYDHPTLKSTLEINSSLDNEVYWLISRSNNISFVQAHNDKYVSHNVSSSDSVNHSNIELKHEQVVRQLVGVCGVHQFLFNKFQTRQSTFYTTVIDKLPSKIVFLNIN